MKIQLFFTLIIFSMMVACSQTQKSTPDQWSENELTEWFNKGEWKQGWNVSPDETINQKEFAAQYFRNQARWDKAFKFLHDENLATLAKGRYELEGADLFVNVDEYITKNEEDALFEAHRKYADIQYVVTGEEQIGVVPLEKTSVTEPYNEEKDIVFLSTAEVNYRPATPEQFFVFFPENAHRPCVKAGDNANVRKIVVKVRID
jgi:YhcH/YjgK/YiaL family protein